MASNDARVDGKNNRNKNKIHTTATTILKRAHKSFVLRDIAKRSCSAPSCRAIYSRACNKFNGFYFTFICSEIVSHRG